MTDYTNPQQTERIWLESLEREMQTFQANVSRACPAHRAMTPPEIQGMIDYTQRMLQFLSQYTPVGAELLQRGFPALAQRLHVVQVDLGEALHIYTDMLRTTSEHEAYRMQVQHQTSTYVTKAIRESTLHSQKVFDQCTEMRNYANHGMPFGWAEFLAKIPK